MTHVLVAVVKNINNVVVNSSQTRINKGIVKNRKNDKFVHR
jgi:hypothetical protein